MHPGDDVAKIRDLVARGANPNCRDRHGDTPMSWGRWQLRPFDILGLLLYGDVSGWHGCPNPNLQGQDLP